MTYQLKPVDEPYSAEVQAILANYPNRDGYILSLFRLFANSVRFLRKGTVNLLDRDSPVTMREREIVILRVCGNNLCEYEWGVHVTAFSSHVELTREQINSTWSGAVDAGLWPEREALLIRVVDDLCKQARITDDNYKLFQQTWNLEQQLEIMALCGNYHTICFVANSTGLANETFAATYPV